MGKEDSVTQPLTVENSGKRSNCRCAPPAEERIMFQPNTPLDRDMASVKLRTQVKLRHTEYTVKSRL